MQADSYYQIDTKKTIPLVLLTTSQYLNGLNTCTAFERNCLAGQQFKGLLGDIGLINDSEGIVCKVYVGAGDNCHDSLAIANVATYLPVGCYFAEQPLSQGAQVAWSLAQYRFDRYKTNESSPRILVIGKRELPAVLSEAKAVFLVRDLINTPTNDMGPQELSERVAKIAKEYGAEFKQWVGDELLRNNFPAIHAVGRGAAAAPRLLSMVWGNENHPRVALVGKGVCFDSGGLDMKSASGMRLMKKDMAGAAHVIGLAQWLMTNRVPIRLHVLIPAVENAVDAQSYRPGDVLTMRNGMKVEVHNTDAEGRLVLADALVKACEEKPELIIDFATLTGAARVAVGPDMAAMFANDDNLANALAESASKANDPTWRLPLFAGYEEMYTSGIANFANASDAPYAGAITAGLFLQRFISTNISWAHFDIMAWNLSNRPGKPEGGEAMGMRAVGQYLREKYS